MSVLWKGSRELTEQHDSPRLVFGDQIARIYTFEGPHDVCVAAAPRKGQNYKGLSVVQAEVDKLEGGRGRLTIRTETLKYQSDGTAQVDEVYEVDWVSLERPLIQHPRYLAGGENPLTDEDRANLEAWRQAPADVKANMKYLDSNGAKQDLSANAQHAAEKLLKGQEYYTESIPVARISSMHVSKPSTTGCDVYRTTPPFDGVPTGLKWMKVVDRATRSGTRGRWVRNVEYKGFAEIDADLYSTES